MLVSGVLVSGVRAVWSGLKVSSLSPEAPPRPLGLRVGGGSAMVQRWFSDSLRVCGGFSDGSAMVQPLFSDGSAMVQRWSQGLWGVQRWFSDGSAVVQRWSQGLWGVQRWFSGGSAMVSGSVGGLRFTSPSAAVWRRWAPPQPPQPPPPPPPPLSLPPGDPTWSEVRGQRSFVVPSL